MRVVIYNTENGKMEQYNLESFSPMPYTENGVMTVGEFAVNSGSSTVWSSKQAMISFNNLVRSYGNKIKIKSGFKRVWETGINHNNQHFVGVGFDVGEDLSTTELKRLHSLANASGQWSNIEDLIDTKTFMHMDKAYDRTPTKNQMPYLSMGDKGCYVMTAQDALNVMGFEAGKLDGKFGRKTRKAVYNFQYENDLDTTGIINEVVWELMLSQALNRGENQYIRN